MNVSDDLLIPLQRDINNMHYKVLYKCVAHQIIKISVLDP